MKRAAVVLCAGLVFAVTVCARGAVAAPSDARELSTLVAYVDRRDDVDWLVVVTADGRRVLKAPDDSTRRQNPAFSPDGRQLAYSTDDSSDRDPGVFVLDPLVDDRSRRVAVGTGEPEWSPSGDRVAYRGVDGALMVVHLATGRLTVVGPGSDPEPPEDGGADRSHSCMRWSSEGSMIATYYQSFYEGGEGFEGSLDEVRVYRADGTGTVGAVRGSAFIGCPTWSPDGARLAFSDNGEIHTARPDGTGQRIVVARRCVGAYSPNWASGGLLFSRWAERSDVSKLAGDVLEPDCAPERWNGVWLADGEGVSRRIIDHGGEAFDPRWSPTGDVFSFGSYGPVIDDVGVRLGQVWIGRPDGSSFQFSEESEDARFAALAPRQRPRQSPIGGDAGANGRSSLPGASAPSAPGASAPGNDGRLTIAASDTVVTPASEHGIDNGGTGPVQRWLGAVAVLLAGSATTTVMIQRRRRRVSAGP